MGFPLPSKEGSFHPIFSMTKEYANITYASSTKSLTCSSCGQPIPIGDTYLKVDDHEISKGYVRLKHRSYCLACSRSWFGGVTK